MSIPLSSEVMPELIDAFRVYDQILRQALHEAYSVSMRQQADSISKALATLKKNRDDLRRKCEPWAEHYNL